MGDGATGVPALSELYTRMGEQPMTADAAGLLKSLGVSGGRAGVAYDDGAPLSAIRRGIQTGSP